MYVMYMTCSSSLEVNKCIFHSWLRPPMKSEFFISLEETKVRKTKKDLESIQSNATPVPGYQMGK